MKHTQLHLLYVCLFMIFNICSTHLQASSAWDILDNPIANNDVANTLQDTWVTIPAISNDIGSAIFLHNLTSAPTNGTAIIMPGKTNIVYTPNAGFLGVDVFTYTIKDFFGNFATAEVSITVIPASGLGSVNVAPTPVFDLEFCTQPMTPLTICHSWTDPNGDDWSINIPMSSTTFHCSLVALNDSCLRYTPLPGFLGTDTVSIVVCDDQTPNLCSTSIALVHVGCITPVANPDVVFLSNTSVVVNGVNYGGNGLTGAMLPVAINDEELCNGVLTLSQINTAPAHGTAVISSGQIFYVPATGYSGTDVLEYTICNGCGLCETTMVNLTITGAGNCPIAEATCIPPFSNFQVCPQFCGVNPATLGTITATINGSGSIIPAGAGCFTYTTSTVFSGTDIITFQVCDGVGNCSTNTTTITIDQACGGNNPPVAVDDTFTATAGETLILNVLNNDSDPEGQPLTISQTITENTCGVVNLIGNQVFYSATSSCTDTDSFQYVICDNGSPALCDTALVLINITPAPVNCEFETDYCTMPIVPIQICVQFCNISDAQITDAVTTFNCSISFLNDTCLQYIALPGFFGTDIVDITGCNSEGECETVSVFVHVGCIAPEANDDAASLFNNGVPVPVNVLTNDTHECNAPMNVQIVTNPSNGTATVNANGTINYLPQPGFAGTDQLTYAACVTCSDGSLLCDNATVVLTVMNPELPPLIAEPDSVTTSQGIPITINVLNNDSGSGLDVTTITQPSNGTAVLNPDNTVTYSPNGGYQGTDTFTYTVCDSGGNCANTTVTITVVLSAINLPPVANDDLANTSEGIPVQIAAILNDFDPDNTLAQLTITLMTLPENGLAVVNAGGSITYTPNSGFTGTDTFVYTLCDPSGLCDEATITIYVLGEVLIDAEPDLVFTFLNTPVAFNVLDNDFGDNIEVTQVLILPQHGSILSFDPITGVVNYLPETGYVGTDYFIYEICNPEGICDATIVAITIQIPLLNQPPTPNNDIAQTPVNTPVIIPVLTNDSDPDNDPLTVTQINTPPQNGEVVINPDGNVTYTPNTGYTGCEIFIYSVCDPSGACAQAIVSVQVGDIGCLNQPPIAIDDVAVATEGIPVAIFVLDNDFDPDGNIASLTASSDPYNGSISILPNETGFIYTSNTDFVGTDYFTYIICDNGSPVLCDTAYVTITIQPANIDAQPDIVFTSINTAVTFNVLSNDFGTAIQLSQVFGGPDFGNISVIPGTGNIVYTPDPGFTGTDYFEYQICDIAGNCDITLVTLIVQPISITNLPPVAVSDLDTTSVNVPVTITVLQNDYDPFGGTSIAVQSSLPSLPTNGIAVVNSNGTITYTPNNGFSGTDTFEYIICDNGTPVLCDTAYVSITVGDDMLSNNPPVALDDMAETPLNTPVIIPVLDNDTDPDGDAVTPVWLSFPAYGVAGLNPDNTVTYTPDENFIGNDYFSYIICDNGSPVLCDTAYVSVFVSADTLNFCEQTLENTPVTLCLDDYLTNITIETITITELPPNGGLVLSDNCIQYLPNPGFVQTDTFSVQVCTPNDNCLIVSFCINVTDVNEPPVAVNDMVATDMNMPVIINVLSNDFDPDGDEITAIVLNSDVSVSGAELNFDFVTMEFTYVPAPDFTGIDSFSYEITDASGLSSNIAWVYITVEGDDIPVEIVVIAVNDSSSTEMNASVLIPVLQNDTIPSGSLPDVSLLDFPENGSVIVNNSDQTFTYIPNIGFSGTDMFNYIVCVYNEQSQLVCDTALVVVVILPDEQNCNVSLAQGFSPNGDGVNDTFIISGIECFADNQPELQIFNRWGDVVYSVSNYTNEQAWNGNWKGTGKNVPDGTYFYRLDLRTGLKSDLKSGFIEVNR